MHGILELMPKLEIAATHPIIAGVIVGVIMLLLNRAFPPRNQ